MQYEDNRKEFFQVMPLGRFMVISKHGMDFDKSKNWGQQVEYSDLNYIMYDNEKDAKDQLDTIRNEFLLDNSFCLVKIKVEEDQYEKIGSSKYRILTSLFSESFEMIELL